MAECQCQVLQDFRGTPFSLFVTGQLFVGHPGGSCIDRF
jgi:hypothetical protein